MTTATLELDSRTLEDLAPPDYYRDLLAPACRESFWRFVQEFWHTVPGSAPLIPNWHMEEMCDVLQAAAERVFKGLPKLHDLIFNVPPGTSKSSIVSILYHPWIWTRMPQARFMSASHAADLVLDLSTKARAVITSEYYHACFPEIELVGDQDTKGYYRNTFGGDRYSCTVAGRSPVGFHAHFQVIDDAIDAKKARSEAEKTTAREFLTDVLPGRKVDKAVTFTALVMQRLCVGDPTDVMLETAKKEDASPILHYCLPAELEDNVSPPEMRERYVDGLLDPNRLPKHVLKREEATMGAYAYASQFRQRPYVPGGGMFKGENFKYIKSAPYKCKRVFFVDRAQTEDGGCYTAGVLMARCDQGHYYIEDVVHGQWDPDVRNKKLLAALLKYRRKYGKYEPKTYIERETGSTGKEALRYLMRYLTGFYVREVGVTGSKDVRAEPWSSEVAAGNVYLVDNDQSKQGGGVAGWDINAYIEEHERFKPDPQSKRLGKFKDQVDGSSGAYNVLCSRSAAGSLPLRKISLRDPDRKDYMTKFLLVSYEDFAEVVIDQPVLVIHLHDHREEKPYPLPASGCLKVVDHVGISFADVDPSEDDQGWDEYNESLEARPCDVAAHKDLFRPMWGAVKRRYDPPYRAIVVVGDDRRAASVCHGIADSLKFPKDKTYLGLSPDTGSTGKDAPHNQHAYDAVRSSCHTVM